MFKESKNSDRNPMFLDSNVIRSSTNSENVAGVDTLKVDEIRDSG